MLAAGSFLFAAFLVPPQTNGVLDVGGYRALRLGTAASAVWTVCAALLVPLTVSDVSGHPLRDHLNPVSIWSAASLVDTAGAWRWTAFIAAAVTLASLPVLRWSWTPALLAGALITLVPLGLTGHSSAGGAHDLATNSLLIHLIAGALWAGGLLALLAHAMRSRRARGPRGPAVLGAGVVVLRRDGRQRCGQRAGADPAARSGAAPNTAGWSSASSSRCVCSVSSGGASVAAGLRPCKRDPGARGPLIRLALIEAARLRGDVRHRGRVGPHPATAAADANRALSRSRSAMTSPGRRRWRGCCSTGGST